MTGISLVPELPDCSGDGAHSQPRKTLHPAARQNQVAGEGVVAPAVRTAGWRPGVDSPPPAVEVIHAAQAEQGSGWSIDLAEQALGGEPVDVGDGQGQSVFGLTVLRPSLGSGIVASSAGSTSARAAAGGYARQGGAVNARPPGFRQGATVANVLSKAGGSSLISVSMFSIAWLGPIGSGALKASFNWWTARGVLSSSLA